MTRHADRLTQHPAYESFPGYWKRHEAAIHAPRDTERGIVGMLAAWLIYADEHRELYGYHECPKRCVLVGEREATQHDPGICPQCSTTREPAGGIGEDYVLGPEWATIGRALLALLNGETGRLDCGTLDGIIRDTLRAEGTEDE